MAGPTLWTHLTSGIAAFFGKHLIGKPRHGAVTLTLPNGKAVTFANLSVNFKNDTIYGDFTSAAGTTKQLDLFNFTVTQPLKFSLTGGISLTEQMGNLAMTSDAVTAFQQGLSLPKAVTLLLPTINFGTIDAKIVPGAQVSAAMLVLGLAAVLVVSNSVVQYGLQRLPANRVSLLMLFEIVIAAVSSWWLATEVLSWKEAAGGLCIVAAGALSGVVHRARPARAGQACEGAAA